MQLIDFDFKNILSILLIFFGCNSFIDSTDNLRNDSLNTEDKNQLFLTIELKNKAIRIFYISHDDIKYSMDIEGIDEKKIKDATDKLQPVHGEKIEISAEIKVSENEPWMDVFKIKKILSEKQIKKVIVTIIPNSNTS